MKGFVKALFVFFFLLLISTFFAANSCAEEELYLYTVTDGEATIYNSSINVTGDLVIPSHLGGYPVVKIGNYAFSRRQTITSIQIPETVKEIGMYAFSDCTALESIELPNGVTQIGEGAFDGCRALRSITLPAGLNRIEGYTFRNCTSLKNVYIPSQVTEIGRFAFTGCAALEEISVPLSVKSMGTSIFYRCDSLKKISVPFVGVKEDSFTETNFGGIFGGSNQYDMPESLKEVVVLGGITIADSAFADCKHLEKISLPATLSSVGKDAFYNCKALKELTVDPANPSYQSKGNCLIHTPTKTLIVGCYTSVIPSDGSVTTIASHAFYGQSKLKSLVIPNTVTKIELGAFEFCDGLEEITLPFVGESASGSGRTNFGSIFGARSIESHIDPWVPASLKRVTVTENCTVAECAFDHCRNLENVTFEGDLKKVGYFAFIECSSLKTILFEGTVRSIEQSAFLNCTALVKAHFSVDAEMIGKQIFENCNQVTVYCAEDSVVHRYAEKNRVPFSLIEANMPEIPSDTTTSAEAKPNEPAQGEKTTETNPGSFDQSEEPTNTQQSISIAEHDTGDSDADWFSIGCGARLDAVSGIWILFLIFLCLPVIFKRSWNCSQAE